ncbi:hypothetical protein EJB05_56595, partial [Eragrostis curvula]
PTKSVQANNNVTEMAQEAAAATNMNTEEVEATPQHEVSSHQENPQRNPEQPEVDDISRATGIRTTRSTYANTARAFVTTKQLKDNVVKRRQGTKKTLTKAVQMEETSDGTFLKSTVADQVMGSPGYEFLC